MIPEIFTTENPIRTNCRKLSCYHHRRLAARRTVRLLCQSVTQPTRRLMTKRLAIFLFLIVLALIGARPSYAQAPTSSQAPGSWIVNLNVGAQPPRRDYVLRNTLTIYDEDASFQALEHVGNGVLFDASVARVRPVWRKV